jgi:hypothetical protein
MQWGARRRSRRIAGAVALALAFAHAAFAQPTLQFELVKYPYPSAPAYAEGEPSRYQAVLLQKTGPVVPGELAANWLWDLVPRGRPRTPTAKLDFHVNQLLGPDLGVVRIKGVAVDDGSGSVTVYLDRYGVAFRKRDFCAATGAATAFRTPLGGFTVVWLGYFPHGMTNLGMYLIVRAKGDGTPYPAYDGKGIVNADGK